MGNNLCHQDEKVTKERQNKYNNTYYQSDVKAVCIQELLSYEIHNHEQYQIGVCFDKSEIDNQNVCIENWQQLMEQYEKKTLTNYQQMDLQKALYYVHKHKPQQFSKIVETYGGGKIRWFVWKTLLFSQITNKHPAMQIRDTKKLSIIDRDVPRTFPNHPYFQLETQSKPQLSHLLHLVGSTFTGLEYTQGMNFLIAFMLMQSGGDLMQAWPASFILFYSSKWMLYGIYMNEFPLMNILCNITKQLLQQRDEELYNHYQSIQVDDAFLLWKWIFTLYLYNLPTQLCLHLWDLIFSKGVFVISSINCELFIQLKKQLMGIQNSLAFLELIQNTVHFEKLVPKTLEIKTKICNNMPQIKQIIQSVNELKKQKFNNPNCYEFLDILSKIQDKDKFKQRYQEWIESKIISTNTQQI